MNTIIVQSQRLLLRPKTMEEMKQLKETEPDAELKQAYGEMIDVMNSLPGREEWASDWSILLRSGEVVGGIGFKGVPDENGYVEIGYGIDEPYRRHGYATEATAALVRWALGQPGVQCVQAQIEDGNEISQKVLLTNGFLRNGRGEEGPLFECRR